MLMSATLGARAQGSAGQVTVLPEFGSASASTLSGGLGERGERKHAHRQQCSGEAKTVHLETVPTMDPVETAAKLAVSEAEKRGSAGSSDPQHGKQGGGRLGGP